MAVQLIRKIRDRQPTRPTSVQRSFLPAEVFLPQSYGENLGVGLDFVRSDFLSISYGLYGAAFARKNAEYNTAIEFPPQTAAFMSILLIVKEGDANGRLFGTAGDVLHGNVGGTLAMSAASSPVNLSPTPSVLITDGSVIFVQWLENNYVVHHRNALGEQEALASNQGLGSICPDSWGRTGAPGIYLVARWPNRIFSVPTIKSLLENPWQIFEPETIPLFFSTVTAQYARPTSDVAIGTWTASTGSDLYAMLDEVAADDGDYITTTGASTCEVALGSLSDPASSAGHIVRYRISSTGGGITVRLRQGTTTIASWTHSPAPTSLTTYEQTLSGAEADSITSYAALKLQFEAY